MKKMYGILGLLFLMVMSVTVFGKSNDQIKYNDNMSITFLERGCIEKYTFPESDLPELIKIFEKAEKLHMYCIQNVTSEIRKEIGIFKQFKFTYVYFRCPETFKGVINIKEIKGSWEDSMTLIWNRESLVNLLTVTRDEYYTSQKRDNEHKKQENNKVDDFLKTI
jgi:hypothetical protein